MQVEPLTVPDSFVFTPEVFTDVRGSFLEWFRADLLEVLVGHPLTLAQANWSTSRRGVVRGIHYARTPPGQAKYVTCVSGAVLDVVVDLRRDSPTFGRYDTVHLDDVTRRAVYLGEGLGHGFCALTDATVLYLCSTAYDPAREHGINPLDPMLGLPWPDDLEPILSAKDAAAPGFEQIAASGSLPTLAQCHGDTEGERR